MSRRVVGVVLVLALVALLPACKRLPVSPSSQPVPTEALVQSDQIPAAWGNLIGVSSVAAYPDLVQLWFQDEQKNVRVVVFQLSTSQLLNARLIRRG